MITILPNGLDKDISNRKTQHTTFEEATNLVECGLNCLVSIAEFFKTSFTQLAIVLLATSLCYRMQLKSFFIITISPCSGSL